MDAPVGDDQLVCNTKGLLFEKMLKEMETRVKSNLRDELSDVEEDCCKSFLLMSGDLIYFFIFFFLK